MKIHFLLMPLLAFMGLALLSCEKDDDNGPDNEQELITTISLKFTGGGQTLTFTAEDKDGDGGSAPVIQAITLKANTDYTLSVSFLDASKTPTEDLTTEVKTESNDHLVCYEATGAMAAPQIQDTDAGGKPLGLESKFKTGAAGAGTFKITLKHEADKSSASACSTGETDAESTFNVTVQ
ncbi:hypothetical protein [Haliscomenobacter hydrossis]|uniref:Type 1 periplasmic binding fold superfamily protein n=1 Tax=Haliscomenobacter hydrossis (strain ATCC 27775 / DSM 1100 / LMG 10767 / O) TaxID=760192 RepID=F4KW61_HALH1|nr:hypothetical protein [Haliscomenobacter hydrossis]AEE49249.1 hypothetical protein Halhy_1354 [Haliscomenobacter hydrossis DSM 1100]